ncbi:hypothetical protein D0A34_21595 [Microcoleus vaginatus PCC 9802]|nr:hypothetical protein D0A34_21595 [Microcoleus vaginatus PCC 9802]
MLRLGLLLIPGTIFNTSLAKFLGIFSPSLHRGGYFYGRLKSHFSARFLFHRSASLLLARDVEALLWGTIALLINAFYQIGMLRLEMGIFFRLLALKLN